MFFFFFGSVQPEVSKVIETTVAACPRCGSDASLVEYDHVFRAFFFPVWRFGGANPAIHCKNCSFLLSLEEFQKLHKGTEILSLPPPPLPRSPPREQRASGELQDLGPSAPFLQCWTCSSILQPEFRFCPQCGASQQ